MCTVSLSYACNVSYMEVLIVLIDRILVHNARFAFGKHNILRQLQVNNQPSYYDYARDKP